MKEELIGLTPTLVKLIAKVVRFSRGGFTPDERRELARDLLELAGKVLDGLD